MTYYLYDHFWHSWSAPELFVVNKAYFVKDALWLGMDKVFVLMIHFFILKRISFIDIMFILAIHFIKWISISCMSLLRGIQQFTLEMKLVDHDQCQIFGHLYYDVLYLLWNVVVNRMCECYSLHYFVLFLVFTSSQAHLQISFFILYLYLSRFSCYSCWDRCRKPFCGKKI